MNTLEMYHTLTQYKMNVLVPHTRDNLVWALPVAASAVQLLLLVVGLAAGQCKKPSNDYFWATSFANSERPT